MSSDSNYLVKKSGKEQSEETLSKSLHVERAFSLARLLILASFQNRQMKGLMR